MANKICRLTNGVSFGARYTVQAADAEYTGVAEILSLTVLTGCTADGNVTITLRDGTPVVIAVTTDADLASEVATLIRAGTYTGWTTGGIGDTVTWTATAVGVKTGANTVAPAETGVTGTITIPTPGEAYSAGDVTFVFKGSGDNPVGYPLVAQIQVVDSDDVNVLLADAVVTYPANGTIKITSGASTFNLTAGYKISVVAQRAVTGADQ